MRTFICTLLALIAFAMNSILCRLALGAATIDAASFSTIRLVSGAIMLLLMMALFKNQTPSHSRSNWASAALLFLYAIAFSLAYIGLSASVGALILFGSVQATMIITALLKGERPHLLEWTGLFLALGGLFYLVSPGLTAPPFARAALMAVAGISWGFYTLRGRGAVDPLADTTNNFVRAVPFAITVNVLMFSSLHISRKGFLLAALSGALTSGVGYVIWYAALKGLTTTRAAMVQLAVPVLAAAGGVVLLSENISVRLVLSAFTILGGIGIALVGHQYLIQVKAEEQT